MYGRGGICISTTVYNSYDGQYFFGRCSDDPNDIKCCNNIPCKADDGRTGSCIFTNQCNGEGISKKCPGNNDFKCCQKKKLNVLI